jgi:hypothetical protein
MKLLNDLNMKSLPVSRLYITPESRRFKCGPRRNPLANSLAMAADCAILAAGRNSAKR